MMVHSSRENPYQAPPRDAWERPPIQPPRSMRLSMMAGLLFASLVTAGLVTPADPASQFLATIPIFVLSIGAYYIGLRHGGRPS